MISTIVWDIGGVLLSNPRVGDFWKTTSGSKELRTLFGEGKLSIADFISEGSRLLNESTDTFHQKYIAIYHDISAMAETISLVGQTTCNNYILSDTNPIHGEYVLNQFSNLFNEFTDVFFSYKLGMRKNSSLVFEVLSDKVGVAPNEILFIDNKEKPIEYARKAGYNTFLFRNPSELGEYLITNDLINTQ